MFMPAKEGIMDSEEILDAYRKSDESKRLGFFLTYRDLRDQFSSIEDESSSGDQAILRIPSVRKRCHKKNIVARAA
jgi:hypothetical protein